jgi:hypothetical protein
LLTNQKSSKKMSAGTSPKKEASSPPVPPIENGESAAQVVEEKTAFSLDNLRLHFEACLGEDGTIFIDKYILGYEELYKFLNLLGTVFTWVASDVVAKLAIIRTHKNGELSEKYVSLQTMLAYEVDEKLIKPKAKDSGTGARNLLRLHRALEYIIGFLEAVQSIEVSEKCCGISQEAYKKTLMKFHPWVVQKAALLAMHMLPTKEVLIQKIVCDDGKDFDEQYKKALETLQAAVLAMQKVYDKTQELYQEKDLLSLP